MFKPLNRIKEKVSVFFIWFLLPVFSGLLFSFYFIWKKNYLISLNLDISNIATIIFAVVFSSNLIRRLSLNDQKSKIKFEMLVNLMNTFEEDFYKNIKQVIEDGRISIKKLPSLLKNHGTRFSKLEQTAIKHEYLDKSASLLIEINQNFIQLRKLMDKPSNRITPIEQYYVYSDEQIGKINEKVVERRLLIFELTVLMSNK